MTATALVLEWSRAEVEAGPSVPEESMGGGQSGWIFHLCPIQVLSGLDLLI